MANEKPEDKPEDQPVETPKRPYKKPVLRFLGSVREVTLGSSGTNIDMSTPAGGNDLPS
jgi:hypothetical protein